MKSWVAVGKAQVVDGKPTWSDVVELRLSRGQTADLIRQLVSVLEDPADREVTATVVVNLWDETSFHAEIDRDAGWLAKDR